MTLATLTNEIQLPTEQTIPPYALVAGLCLLFAGIFVYRKMIRRIGIRGGLVRSDLFGLPDVLVTGTLVILLLLLVVMQWVSPPAKPPDTSGAHGASGGVNGLHILYSALLFLLPVPAILVLLIARGVSLPLLFGLKRVGPLRAICIAAGLVLLLLPVIILVTEITGRLLGGHAESQEMVKIFQKAAKTGKAEIVWQVIVNAVVIAPLTEEFLFRGYFYPVLKRFAGAVPAALGISLLFGALHVTAASLPVLTVLALALTLAYEWSGSILVPVCMHVWFNTTMLALMWWQVRHGATP